MSCDDKMSALSSDEEKKELQAALSEAEARCRVAEGRLNALLDSVVDGIVTIGLDGRVQSYNKAAERLFVYSADEVIGNNITMLMAKDIRPQHEQGFERYKSSRKATILGSCVEVMAQNKSGKLIPVELTISEFCDGNDSLFTGIIRDITQRKKAEEKIRYMALHDPLTGLANRNLFNIHIERAIDRAKRNDTDIALMYLDLDNFKPINDEHGHEVGDVILQRISERFKKVVRATDIVARVGGDEFVAILEIINGRDNAAMLAERLITTVNKAVPYNGRYYEVGVSIGIAIFPEDGESADELLKAADKAMYAAKKGGRKQALFFGEI